jgi:hypothetical protein
MRDKAQPDHVDRVFTVAVPTDVINQKPSCHVLREPENGFTDVTVEGFCVASTIESIGVRVLDVELVGVSLR